MLVPQFPENLHNLTFSRMDQFLCYLKITSPFRCQQSLIVHLFIDRKTTSPPFFPVQHFRYRAQEKVVLGHKCGYHLLNEPHSLMREVFLSRNCWDSGKGLPLHDVPWCLCKMLLYSTDPQIFVKQKWCFPDLWEASLLGMVIGINEHHK